MSASRRGLDEDEKPVACISAAETQLTAGPLTGPKAISEFREGAARQRPPVLMVLQQYLRGMPAEPKSTQRAFSGCAACGDSHLRKQA